MSDDIVMRLRAGFLAWRVSLLPEAADEIERLRSALDAVTRERDEARAWAAKLLATLEMVRDADNDCRVEGWATIPDAVRRSIDEALEAKP